jgi:hypothetical protein
MVDPALHVLIEDGALSSCFVLLLVPASGCCSGLVLPEDGALFFVLQVDGGSSLACTDRGWCLSSCFVLLLVPAGVCCSSLVLPEDGVLFLLVLLVDSGSSLTCIH